MDARLRQIANAQEQRRLIGPDRTVTDRRTSAPSATQHRRLLRPWDVWTCATSSRRRPGVRAFLKARLQDVLVEAEIGSYMPDIGHTHPLRQGSAISSHRVSAQRLATLSNRPSFRIVDDVASGRAPGRQFRISQLSGEFRFGIEEEFFLADAETCMTPEGEAADRFHKVAAEAVAPASHELIKGQVEVQTSPGTSFDEAQSNLRRMRRDLAVVAREQGLLLFAAGSHPLAEARHEDTTREERYERLREEFGIIAERSVVSAMHIHVEVPNASTRIDLMNRMLPFLPVFLALSVSSPFWEGRESGLQCFRLTAFSQWPRMGLPELFGDKGEYERFVAFMVANKVIRDASFLWWHIRPSTKFPTIELRICDSCTRVEDAVAIAALYQALLRRLARDPNLNAGFGPVGRGLCAENIWQVQHHGAAATLIDAKLGDAATVLTHLDGALDLVREDANALGTTDWVTKTRDIILHGTSADRQLANFRGAKSRDLDDKAALLETVRTLAEETLA